MQPPVEINALAVSLSFSDRVCSVRNNCIRQL
jgi:hypothetical protein